MSNTNKKTRWQLFLMYVWLPFATFMTASDLIQISDNFWPTLSSWSSFIWYIVRFMVNVRDAFFSWIPSYVPEDLKDYLFFGIFFSTNIVTSFYLFIDSEVEKKKTFAAFVEDSLVAVLLFLTYVVLWPFVLLLAIVYSPFLISLGSSEIKSLPKHNSLVFYYTVVIVIVRSVFLFLILLFLNFLFYRIVQHS